jgi:hypothetical protein
MMFTEEDMRIFAYQDGSKDANGTYRTVYADPMEISRRFVRLIAEHDLDAIQKRIAETSSRTLEDGSANPRYNLELAAEDMGKLVPVYREILSIPPFDRVTGAGLTDLAVLKVFREYIAWVSDVKKNSEPSPPISPSTAGVPGGMGAEAMPPSPTPNIADLPLTANAPKLWPRRRSPVA